MFEVELALSGDNAILDGASVLAWCAGCGLVQNGMFHAPRFLRRELLWTLPAVVVHCVCGVVTRHIISK